MNTPTPIMPAPIGRRPIAGRLTNPIGLGCMSLNWGYGTPPAPEDAARMLHRALDLGYDHLDTARIYGEGRNEALIGETLRQNRDKFFLASKTGIIIDGATRRIDCSPETIRRACDESLALLQTDHIDLYYLHRRDFTVPIEESIGALGDLVKAGKIGAIGVSEMSAETLRRAAAEHPVAAIQNEYSLWSRNAELGVLEAARQLGTCLVAFSPVGRGALAGGVRDVDALPKGDLRKHMPRFDAENWPANLALIDAFAAIAAAQGVTPAQLSLAWVLSRGDHVVAIPGTANAAHLEQNIARWDWQPSPQLLDEIGRLINQQTVAGHRYGPAIRSTIDTEDYD